MDDEIVENTAAAGYMAISREFLWFSVFTIDLTQIISICMGLRLQCVTRRLRSYRIVFD